MKALKHSLTIVAGLILACFAGLYAQTPAAQSTVGTVTKIDTAARAITLKNDQGQEFAVSLAANASFRRVAPGETNLANASAIAITDIGVGDRLLARGRTEGQTVAATLVVVMSQGDVAKKQADEKADWDKRGVSGLVTAVNAETVTISVRGLAGAKSIMILPAKNAVIRRYAPDSISFAEAKPSKLEEIKPGDQVRARGDKSEDGAKVTAVEIVSGTFKTMAGLVLSIDADKSEISVRDLDTKKPVVVKINKDSKMQRVQPQVATLIAARLHPEAAGGGRGGGAGAGGGRGGGRGGAVDIPQMLEGSPAATLADLKNGDAVVVTSTVGAAADRVNAISVLAGVEPILTKPGTQEMSIGSWNLDVGGGVGP